MTHYEEDIQDSAFADTWQKAEADRFLKDEAAHAATEREDEHAEWVADGCPALEEDPDWRIDLYKDQEGSPF